MQIDQLGEFGLIDRIHRSLPQSGPDVLVGIGDDVAILRSDGKNVWLATCDIQMEGVHFLREAISPCDLGHKALAINLSDVAASGGAPRFALVSLGLPKGLPVEFVDGLYKGLRAEAEKFGVDIVGGNISNSRLGVFIDIFLLGEAPRENILLRSGAKVGDQILVTGSLGDAAAGVSLLLDGSHSTTEAYAAQARVRRDTPIPRVREGLWIGASHQATAMMDISDGLAGDLGHLCQQSGVGARVYAQKLPVVGDNRSFALAVNGNEWYFALHGGEDYEILFTVPASLAERVAGHLTRETGTPVTIIGEILPPNEGMQLVLPDLSTMPLQALGWDHFKEK